MIRETEGTEKLKNSGMVTRVLSGLALFIILLLTGLTGGYLLLLVTVFTGLVGLYEFYRATGVFTKAANQKDNILAYAGFAGSIVYYLLMALGGVIPVGVSLDIIKFDSIPDMLSGMTNLQTIMSLSYVNLIFLFIILEFALLLGIYVFTFPKYDIEHVSFAFVGVIYVPVFMSFAYLVRGLDGGKYLFWLIFISSWVCDTCAYFVGSAIGKHKLAPVLSPKKSIEGAVGGIIGSVIVAFLFAYFVKYKFLRGTDSCIQYMIICAVGAVVSQIGDLAASAVKRNKDIKDYGSIIPGHGGILDRFDSVIFTAPFIYILSQILARF